MKRPKMFAVLPTLLTLGNLACGFGSITFAAKVGFEETPGNHLFVAAVLIFLAMLFDMLDGSAARWTNQTSDFGAQLDSLCDALSFGAAPAFLMLQFVRYEHPYGSTTAAIFEAHPRLLWVIGVLFVICAVLRLARFNVESEEDDSHDSFSGLPSPAAAGVVASFPIALRGLNELADQAGEAVSREVAQWLIPAMKWSLPFITLAVACLMVSRIRYVHIFNQLFSGQRNRQHVIQLVFSIAAVFLVKEMAVPLIFCWFAFAAPVKALWRETAMRRLHKSARI